MFIPGIVISVLSFPGIVMHELGHYLFCRLKKVPVYEVKYFQFDLNTAGYVLHAKPETFSATFLICVGPLIVNTLLCLFICIPAAIPYHVFGDRSVISYFYLWLGISMGMHAFPSTQDAKVLWAHAVEKTKEKNILAILSMPLVVLIYVANILRFFWFDALYGFFIGVLVPMYIVKLL